MRKRNHSSVRFATTYICFEKSSMNRNIASVQEKKKPFKWGICDYSSAQESCIHGHIVSGHEGQKKSECDFCDVGFARKYFIS